MGYLEDPDVRKAALIIVGNEILSGRTVDKNTNWIAEKMVKYGISLVEARTVTDQEHKIIRAINDLKDEVDYVFTTGGIGPTHDDITAESVAKAFDVELEMNEEALLMLVDHYGAPEEVTEARRKMAMIPKGATLIHNKVSGAPGFVIGNVHVMAGVPRIMHAMFEYLLDNVLETGKQVYSNNLLCTKQESELAPKLMTIQDAFPDVEIGSYPHYREGQASVSVVLRSTEKESLKKATERVLAAVETLGDTPSAMSFQVMID
ncbi:MAG: molybdopterin-binding protein [Pseudomonadota bacterium]